MEKSWVLSNGTEHGGIIVISQPSRQCILPGVSGIYSSLSVYSLMPVLSNLLLTANSQSLIANRFPLLEED